MRFHLWNILGDAETPPRHSNREQSSGCLEWAVWRGTAKRPIEKNSWGVSYVFIAFLVAMVSTGA